MASLYQRFTGKINTSASFPGPPEASRLLGAREKATRSPEPKHEQRRGTAREDEDVRLHAFFSPKIKEKN